MSLRFLSDQCVPAEITGILQRHGHQITLLREVLPIRSLDPAVIAKAQELGAILLSLNGDFAGIVAYPPANYFGILAVQLHNRPEIIPQLMERLGWPSSKVIRRRIFTKASSSSSKSIGCGSGSEHSKQGRKSAVAKLHRWGKERGEGNSHHAKTMVLPLRPRNMDRFDSSALADAFLGFLPGRESGFARFNQLISPLQFFAMPVGRFGLGVTIAQSLPQCFHRNDSFSRREIKNAGEQEVNHRWTQIHTDFRRFIVNGISQGTLRPRTQLPVCGP